MLFVFVEGSDDERFFSHYFRNREKDVKVVQYACMSKKELSNYIV